jgi:hypothetical protein
MASQPALTPVHQRDQQLASTTIPPEELEETPMEQARRIIPHAPLKISMSQLPHRTEPIDLKSVTDTKVLTDWLVNQKMEPSPLLLNKAFYCPRCHFFKDTKHQCPVWEKDGSPFQCYSFQRCPSECYARHPEVPKPWTIQDVKKRLQSLANNANKTLREQRKKNIENHFPTVIADQEFIKKTQEEQINIEEMLNLARKEEEQKKKVSIFPLQLR